ncbi:chemotaxis protein CheW [Pseudobacteriovorax antillogorgiicola]|nr:chemotaxis protein CheW [Pseudobacteriovorax antillogorgiicola]
MIGGSLFAIDMDWVDSVCELHRSDMKPLDNSYTEGVMFYHFRRIPVVKTANILDLDSETSRDTVPCVTLKVPHGLIGLPVDKIVKIEKDYSGEITPIYRSILSKPDIPFLGLIQTIHGNAIVIDFQAALPEDILVSVFNSMFCVKDVFASNFVFNLGAAEYYADQKLVSLPPFHFDPALSEDCETVDIYQQLKDSMDFVAGVVPHINEKRGILLADLYEATKILGSVFEERICMRDFKKGLDSRKEQFGAILDNLDRDMSIGDLQQITKRIKSILALVKISSF